MRWNYGVTAATLTLLVALRCATTSSPAPGTLPADASQPLFVDGFTTVKSLDAHTLTVSVDDARNADGRADHVFNLFTEETLPTVNQSFPRAHVEFFGKELRLIPAEQDLVITLALSQVAPRPETVAKVVRYTGYGLNHYMGKDVQTQIMR